MKHHDYLEAVLDAFGALSSNGSCAFLADLEGDFLVEASRGEAAPAPGRHWPAADFRLRPWEPLAPPWDPAGARSWIDQVFRQLLGEVLCPEPAELVDREIPQGTDGHVLAEPVQAAMQGGIGHEMNAADIGAEQLGQLLARALVDDRSVPPPCRASRP